MYDSELVPDLDLRIIDPDLAAASVTLATLRPGDCGVVTRVGACEDTLDHGVARSELERRLLEIGFVEGARVQVLHEGLFGRDPMAVKLDDMRVALRRREAREIAVRLDAPADVRS